MAESKFLTKLSQNLLEILNDDEEYYDITIEVGNDPYAKVFHAHKVILNYRSLYLRRILSTNKKKNDETLTHIKLTNILPEIFQIILKYIYGGKLSLNDYDVPDIINILVAARDLNLQELIPHLQTFLIKNETNWMEQNFNLIYQTSFKDDSFLDLQKFCTELISKQPEKIFKSPSFVSISEEALIAIIRSDNLQMNEVQIWEHVLKWGIAQNPELSSDSSSYSNGDFVALKNTLQLCIPHIKFIKFTSREFLNKVYPYKKIIPEELYESLIRVFLDNDYNPSSKIESQMKEINIDSKIITNQHVGLISKWIDKLEITNGIKNLYEFKLILRGSRDGFMPKTFHEMCDNISCTISIVKIKNSTEIVGGYNPIKWKNEGGFGITNNSFIFSFMNKENIEDHLLSRVNDERKAINFWTYCGPSFGRGDLSIYGGGSDFYNNCKCFCRKRSYEKKIRNTEYEKNMKCFSPLNID
ncbi:hypothetical protein RclHR1_00690008 [Rhizophagus clarus]|uniref:BTB domain-containing protein n=1 Tax=Rhizophagus clarus TaxID=94130 RepID=A0A2Z6RTU6_9GLOM|nr:hypothetical protein RclHR1_00690008 [Rhizophagus clarus]